MRSCYFCGQEIDDQMEIFRSTLCPSCGRELKICMNCRFYSSGRQWDCAETIPEQVKEKDRANFCSYFKMKENNAPRSADKVKDARKNFDKLFGE